MIARRILLAAAGMAALVSASATDAIAAEIGASAERPTVGGQHRAPDRRIVLELLHGVGDAVDLVEVEEVVRRAVHHHHADVAVNLDVQSFSHGRRD